MLRYQTIPVTPFQQNCSVVWCDQTMEGAVIDPGGDLPLVLAEVRRLGKAGGGLPKIARQAGKRRETTSTERRKQEA